jgi:hypothetical protein
METKKKENEDRIPPPTDWWEYLVFFVVMGSFLFGVFYLFTFRIKTTDEYKCVVAFVKQNKTVIEEVGEPVKPSFMASSRYFKQEGRLREAVFSFEVSGPKGRGEISASTYRTPIGESMYIRFQGRDLYRGSFYCP